MFAVKGSDPEACSIDIKQGCQKVLEGIKNTLACNRDSPKWNWDER